jgi:hypothetical protein
MKLKRMTKSGVGGCVFIGLLKEEAKSPQPRYFNVKA